MADNKGCTCDKCIYCCYNSPGWFGSISEIEGAAKILELSIVDFCKEYLIREWIDIDGIETIVPAPRKNFERKNKMRQQSEEEMKKLHLFDLDKKDKIRNGKGFVKATWGHNLMAGYACIFLNENNRCIIHDSKPQECRTSFACEKDDKRNNRIEVVGYWKNHQNWINDLKT